MMPPQWHPRRLRALLSLLLLVTLSSSPTHAQDQCTAFQGCTQCTAQTSAHWSHAHNTCNLSSKACESRWQSECSQRLTPLLCAARLCVGLVATVVRAACVPWATQLDPRQARARADGPMAPADARLIHARQPRRASSARCGLPHNSADGQCGTAATKPTWLDAHLARIWLTHLTSSFRLAFLLCPGAKTRSSV